MISKYPFRNQLISIFLFLDPEFSQKIIQTKTEDDSQVVKHANIQQRWIPATDEGLMEFVAQCVDD